MKKYIVSVTRVSYSCRDIIVNAENEKQARKLALEFAGDYDFSEHDADYEVSHCVENNDF